MLRSIDRFVELDGLRQELAPFYSEMGRPSIDPELLIQADASDRTRVQGAAGLPPDAAGRAVEEYLAVLDNAAFGAATEVTPKFIAPADPATRWTAAHRGPAFFAYSANYLIDTSRCQRKRSRCCSLTSNAS